MNASVVNLTEQTPTLSYEEMIKREGIYRSDEPSDESMRVLVLQNLDGKNAVLYVNDGLIQPLADSWKSGKFLKVNDELQITVGG